MLVKRQNQIKLHYLYNNNFSSDISHLFKEMEDEELTNDEYIQQQTSNSDEDGDWCEKEYEDNYMRDAERADDRKKGWNRIAIENDGCPVNMMQQIISEFVLYNQENVDISKGTGFVVGWCPISVAEVVCWIEDIVKRIIIVDASFTIEPDGCLLIKGLMIRRPKTTILNHTKFEAGRRHVLVKIKNYNDHKQENQPDFLIPYNNKNKEFVRNAYLMTNFNDEYEDDSTYS